MSWAFWHRVLEERGLVGLRAFENQRSGFR